MAMLRYKKKRLPILDSLVDKGGRVVNHRHLAAPMRAVSELDDVRIARLGPIPALLRELNCDPERVMASAGFDYALFETPDARVSYMKAAEMLVACAKASKTPHFGLLIGTRFDLSMLGVLDLLLRNSDTVRTALQQLVRHLHLNDNGAAAFLMDIEGVETAVGYSIFQSNIPGAMHIYGIVLASVCGIMRALCGPAFRPKRILFAHDVPEDVAPYRQFYRAPLHYNAAYSAVVFANRWLDLPLKGADSGRRLSAERIALTEEALHDRHFVFRVRRTVYELLMLGDVSTRAICAHLDIHERILRRHLRAEGATVKHLIGAARHEIACQLLGNTQMSSAEIAAVLGYSDATAFSRAYRNFSGTTPNAWRTLKRQSFEN